MCHVLIIEDEPLLAELLVETLLDEGATSCAIAATEDEAVVAACTVVPAFIVSDVKLKRGTGPKAVAAILRELGPIPVLFATATPWECEPCEPPARVIDKPFSLTTVVSHFHQLVPQYRPRT